MAEHTTYEPVEGRTMAGIDKLFKEKQFIEWVKKQDHTLIDMSMFDVYQFYLRSTGQK